jgi:hypothetical protein
MPRAQANDLVPEARDLIGLLRLHNLPSPSARQGSIGLIKGPDTVPSFNYVVTNGIFTFKDGEMLDFSNGMAPAV